MNDTTLEPSGIGEAVRNSLNPWFISLRFTEDHPILEKNDWIEANKPLSPLQAKTGDKFEKQIYKEMKPESSRVVDSWYDYERHDKNREKFRNIIESVSKKDPGSAPTLLLQARFSGEIGNFHVAGDADLIVCWPTKNGVHLRVIDIKSSWEEKPYQQIQTATYTVLLRQLLEPLETSYTITAGIIYRESDVTPITPATLPEFTLKPRENDVKQLLRKNGPFDRALKQETESLKLAAGTAAQGSPYAEIYNTRAAENKSLGLLGLTRGEQHTLQKHGIEDLSELAVLYKPLDDPRPYDHEKPTVRSGMERTVQKLEESQELTSSLPIIVQQAQAMLGTLEPSHPFSHDKPWTPWLQGVGNAKIPEDDPPYDTDDLTIERNSLIRVYCHIEYDYVRDSIIMASGVVDCSKYQNEPLSFSVMDENISTDESIAAKQEKELLENFADDVFATIDLMSNMTGQSDEAPVHFYLYTEQEKEKLVESLDEYSDTSDSIGALRELFAKREGIDQPMVSIIQPEVERCMALKTPVTGLLPIMRALNPRNDDDKISRDDWIYKRDDGTKVDLQTAFNDVFFRFARPFIHTRNGCSFNIDDNREPDGFFNVLPRYDSQIPLEYLWGSVGKFGLDWVEDDEENQRKKQFIRRFLWADRDKTERITEEDVKKLSEKLGYALRHVERSLTYRDVEMDKYPINMDNLHNSSVSDRGLAEACSDYLNLEYHSHRTETLSTYRKDLKQRILDGESVPLRLTHVEDRDYMLYAEAELIYDEFDFTNPQQVAESTRIQGSDAVTSGSWLVATPLKENNGKLEPDVYSPEHIEHSTPVIVEDMDPRNGTITIESYRVSRDSDDPFTTWYHSWTTDSSSSKSDYVFSEGDEFILDPSSSNQTAAKAVPALNNAESNQMYQEMTKFRYGKKEESYCTKFEESSFEPYLEWIEKEWTPTPNPRQKEFITSGDDRFVLLQGPPGTGKTSGALAHSLIGRCVAAHEEGFGLKGAVSGSSNKAVDEVLEDVADILQEYQATAPHLDDVQLVRLILDEPPENPHPNITYLNYNNDDAKIDSLKKIILDNDSSEQTTLSTGEQFKHTILFGTPSRLQKILLKMYDDEVDESLLYSSSPDIFDVFAVDEGSMMPLPEFLLCSAFVDSNGQALVAGDQRQMPPVQTHDWKDEKRPSIVNHLPYLSTLNYLRFLRGDDIDADTDSCSPAQPSADIPLVKLEQTYRCHKQLAGFLREWMYSQDNLSYESDETELLPEITADTEGLSNLLENDSPVTLVVHDDSTSQQVNFAEAGLIKSAVQEIPKSESIGVVSPHNAQKGLLSTLCADRATVDTVERFQGGERDAVIVSATVSDPDYLDAESDFIMSPNRVNVAMSRMKKKLIMVVPRTLFQHIPHDAEGYENARLWKGLFQDFNVAEQEPTWEGTLNELVIESSIASGETNLEIYTEMDQK